ncbi:MAG: SCO family protein [Acidobacteria bacterium]|nr:SCO family protein [Acidobacteriota bacterium]MBV9071527.1 SCO family protein [Acidobacteriota bacterium]MBV9187026.1 SCO family protein [Acidobacteriota bacterium]
MFRRLLLPAVFLAFACHHESDLPKLFPIPEAQLVTETGKPVRMSEMKGNVVVYDFIFTSCAGTCPMMTATMQKLTKKIPKQSPVRFVSISVDPIRDTPEVLRGYAMYARNDPRWMFLTGDGKTIVDLSAKGFKLAAGDATGAANESVLHSVKFAIADKNGVIREYYSATNDDAVDHVASTVNELLRED